MASFAETARHHTWLPRYIAQPAAVPRASCAVLLQRSPRRAAIPATNTELHVQCQDSPIPLDATSVDDSILRALRARNPATPYVITWMF